jgi:Ni/Fe-hydrogenase b-type cytochrome subunit
MKKIYLNPLPVRIWHWLNALSFLVLIVTGIQIRYRDIVSLFSFDLATDLHDWFGFILIGNFFIWLVYYLAAGKIKLYIPPLHRPVELIKGIITQSKYYGYGIFVGEPNPHHPTPDNKFNPQQQLAYLMIMTFLIPAQLVTGLLLWDPKLFSKWIALLGGIRIIDTIHVLIFIFFSSFLFVHLYLATLGHTFFAHTKAMITGYEEEEEEEHSH